MSNAIRMTAHAVGAAVDFNEIDREDVFVDAPSYDAAMARITMIEAALWYWIDDYVNNNDDPGYEDPFWFLKDKPFYPILQERLKVLTQSDADGGDEHG